MQAYVSQTRRLTLSPLPDCDRYSYWQLIRIRWILSFMLCTLQTSEV
jgi:hypothetical protein